MKNRNFFLKTNTAGFVLSAALLVALAQCASSANGQGVALTNAPPVVVQDDYVYCSSYGVYYNSGRHQYAYLQGGARVKAPVPGGISFEALWASSSVSMDFHDSPANHLAAMVRQYPKNWRPSASKQGQKQNLKAGSPDDNKKMSEKQNVSISPNTISTEVFANRRSGSSIANTNAPEPPTNLRVVSQQ